MSNQIATELVTFVDENATQANWTGDDTYTARGDVMITVTSELGGFDPNGSVFQIWDAGDINGPWPFDDRVLLFTIDISDPPGDFEPVGGNEENSVFALDCWGKNVYFLTQNFICVWYEDMIPGVDDPAVFDWPSDRRPFPEFDNQGEVFQFVTDFRGVIRDPIMDPNTGDPGPLELVVVNTVEVDVQVASATSMADINVDDPETTRAHTTPVWHGLVRSSSNRTETIPTSTYGTQKVFAHLDAYNNFRLNRELSGAISPLFFEEAYFGFKKGDSNFDGGWVALQCNRGQTNSIYAGEQWDPQSGPISQISPSQAWSMYNTSTANNLGWHVTIRDTNTNNGEYPEEAWLIGRSIDSGTPGAVDYGTSEYTFSSEGYADDTSSWSPTLPSGWFQSSAWLSGFEGRWTATIAVARQSENKTDYHITTHLQPGLPTTNAIGPITPRTRFV